MFAFLIFATAFGSGAHAYESPWNTNLSLPPTLTPTEISEAEEELLPENWNTTRVAYASDHGQVMPDTMEKSAVYAELSVVHRIGKAKRDSSTSSSLYIETPIPLGEDLSVFAVGYYDREFQEVYAGLAKKFGNWQFGLGFGSAWSDGSRKTVIAPWMYYGSDEYEASILFERYLKDRSEPYIYKASIEKKFGDFQFGVYAEKDFGTGPLVTWKVSSKIKFFVTVPVVHLPDDGRMRVLIGMKISTE